MNAPAESTSHYSPGQVLQAYRLTDFISRGRFSEVWIAEHTETARKRAVKIITDTEFAAALRERNHVQWKIIHSRIVRTIAINLNHSPPFCIMEYVSADNLQQVIRKHGRLSVPDALFILKEVLDAVEYVHGMGAMIGTLWSGNVLIDRQRKVKICGLVAPEAKVARIRSVAANPTQDAELNHKFAMSYNFLSPELRQQGNADYRSDLFSCGMLLFEMLTGHVKSADRFGELQSLNVPEIVQNIIARSVNTWTNRYTSSRDMRAEVESARLFLKKESERKKQQEAEKALQEQQRREKSARRAERIADCRRQAEDHVKNNRKPAALQLWHEMLRLYPGNEEITKEIELLEREIVSDKARTPDIPAATPPVPQEPEPTIPSIVPRASRSESAPADPKASGIQDTGDSSGQSDADVDSPAELIKNCRLEGSRLERQGDFENALLKWYELLEFKPGDAQANIAITRLTKRIENKNAPVKKTAPAKTEPRFTFSPKLRLTLAFIGVAIVLAVSVIFIFRSCSKHSGSVPAPEQPTAPPIRSTASPTPKQPRPTYPPTRTPLPEPTRTPHPTRKPKPTRTPIPHPIPGFSYIPSGAFKMGLTGDLQTGGIPAAVHVVQLRHGFYMARKETIQKDWNRLMGNHPSNFKSPHRPVERVTWFDAVIYCNRLSIERNLKPCYYSDEKYYHIFEGTPPVRSGTVFWNRRANGYRLPTEAEWEYACRAGSGKHYSWGNQWNCANGMAENDTVASEDDCVRYYIRHKLQPDATAIAGSFPPNRFGLFDMHGNVAEWCWDWAANYDMRWSVDPIGPKTGKYRIVRGGSWNDLAKNCASGARGIMEPGERDSMTGFRVCRNPH